jgi:hypothetical protein
MKITFTPRQSLLWLSIAKVMRIEHDAGGGYFSTEEVEMVEQFVRNMDESMKQDAAKVRTKKRKLL